ncbi:MAG: 3-deoxy-8-phosphooctulonate synthase [Gemmatimonadota bacterium]
MTGWQFAREGQPFLIAGPCVVEPNEVLFRIADRLVEIGRRLGIPVCFKASFDKANRSGVDAARGPGIEEGLAALEGVRRRTGLPLLTDVHEPAQVARVAEVVDAVQVPAFLCRQTDLLVACGAAGKPVNVKKGQWMDAEAMRGAVEKVRRGGSSDVAVTERGTFFGYGDLVVDFRNVSRLRQATRAPVVFDATHSVQQPGRGHDGTSGGAREFVPVLLKAAAAAGVDGFFLETHPDPAQALSDRETQWPLGELEGLVQQALRVWRAAQAGS